MACHKCKWRYLVPNTKGLANWDSNIGFAHDHWRWLCCNSGWASESMSESNGRVRGMHYNDVIMGTIASQITSLTIVYSTVYSDADQRKHQSSASLAFVRGIHRGPVNSPHKWPVTRKMFPFDDVIMDSCSSISQSRAWLWKAVK